MSHSLPEQSEGFPFLQFCIATNPPACARLADSISEHLLVQRCARALTENLRRGSFPGAWLLESCCFQKKKKKCDSSRKGKRNAANIHPKQFHNPPSCSEGLLLPRRCPQFKPHCKCKLPLSFFFFCHPLSVFGTERSTSS